MRFDSDTAPEIIEFEGVEYRRMGGKRRYYLSQSTSNEGRKRAKGLHVAIWESNHGRPVPPGHDVHHVDGDTFNFSVGNLECLEKLAHQKLPKRFDREANRLFLQKIRPKASEWHRSAEGRKWHSAHAFKSIVGCVKPKGDERRVIEVRRCEWCGKEFEARHWRRKFCKPSCRDHVVYLKARGSGPLHPYYASRINQGRVK